MDTFEQIAEQLYNEGALNVAPAPTEAPSRPGAHQPTARTAYDAAAHGSVQQPQPKPQAQPQQPPQQPAQAGGMKTGITTAATSDAVLQKLMASDAYRDPGHPEHRQALADLARHYAEMYPEAADGDTAAPDVGDLRRAVGVTVDLPPQYADAWNKADEAAWHKYVIAENISTASAQRMVDWLIDMHTFSGGNLPADAADRFAAEFSRELTPIQIRQLTSWYRGNAR